MMHALRLGQFGAEPALAQVPRPKPGPGEVLVRIAACGLNFADLLMIEGRYQRSPAPPLTLGQELSGTVEEVGPGGDSALLGQRVAIFSGQGGLAEWGCFAAERCVILPEGVGLVPAAGLLVGHGTAHLALAHRARLARGETLAVLGAAGGAGLAAVEIGRRMGAHVVACARGAGRLEVARTAGADTLIDTAETPDLKQALRALGGVDVVYDAVGGPATEAALRACKPEARLVVIGFASGTVGHLPANHLMVRNVDAIGVDWGAYLAFRPAVLRESLATLMGWHAAGAVAPRIGHVLPFESALEGLDLLRSRRATGKIVITIAPEAAERAGLRLFALLPS